MRSGKSMTRVLQIKEVAEADVAGIDQFLDTVRRLGREKELQAATDQVYELFDRLLTEGSFETCDRILMRVDVGNLSTSLLRSFLTITAAAKEKLKARDDFFTRVEREMIRQRGEETTKRLLSRLV
jgi:hypothetical protein